MHGGAGGGMGGGSMGGPKDPWEVTYFNSEPGVTRQLDKESRK